MKKRYNMVIILVVVVSALVSITGCNTLSSMFKGDGVRFEDMSDDISSLAQFEKEYNSLIKDDFTEVEKYYIGRSTSAFVLKNYELVKNKALTEYVNMVGQTIALASNKSTTYNGYRFSIFKDDKPNAYATSGGMILISTGILSIMDNEDELAGVIAHEVEHVVCDHPTKAVKTETKKKALSNIAKYYAGEAVGGSSSDMANFLNGMVDSFDSVLGDVVDSLDNGYERKTEFEADNGAVMTLQRAGYSIDALISMIDKLPNNKNKSNYGSVHPKPQDRIKAIKREISKSNISPHKILEVRKQRFIKEMSKAGIKKNNKKITHNN